MLPQTPLNKTQLEILRMFNSDLSEEELLEIKRLFTKYLADKATRLANEVWDKKGWSNADMERLSKEHLRTPYKRNS